MQHQHMILNQVCAARLWRAWQRSSVGVRHPAGLVSDFDVVRLLILWSAEALMWRLMDDASLKAPRFFVIV